MLTVISPAKRLNFAPVPMTTDASEPAFQAEATSLSKTARRLSIARLQALMSISPDLARLNHSRFRAFAENPTPEATKPAVLAFAGDTYLGLEAASLEPDETAYAQDHLRILSGLYGLLRPLDRIQPYRLEMGARLATRRGKNLYRFWGDKISLALNDAARQTGARMLLNCASVEYFKAVARDSLTIPVITPQFLDVKNNEARIISFFAKKARGAMARFVIQNRIVDSIGLLDFDTGGYLYQPAMSRPQQPVFLRGIIER